MKNDFPAAEELEVSSWLNTTAPLLLPSLRGKIVALHAFQMLCPGCVLHGIPQAGAIHELYKDTDNVQVIGLHTVFEHHDVMGRDALEAFVHEYQIQFPVAIDKPLEEGSIPATMKKYQLQGTPSLVLIDQQGRIRLKHFGRLSDMHIGSAIGQLSGAGPVDPVADHDTPLEADPGCSRDGCSL